MRDKLGGGGSHDNGGFPQAGLKQQKVAPPPDVINTQRSSAAAAAQAEKELDYFLKIWRAGDKRKKMSGRMKVALFLMFYLVSFLATINIIKGLRKTDCQVVCKNGPSCVEPSKWCDGVRDCYDGEDESHCFRLHGTESLLQSFSPSKQQWMPVCAEAWNDSYGQAACEQLGFRRQDYVSFNRTHAESLACRECLKLKRGSSPQSSLQSQLAPSQCSSDGAVTVKCVECGQPSVAPGRRVAGGGEAVGGAWPWQVSLQINSQHICGGSIISPVWILSAAHCFQDCYKNPALWRVYLGDVSLSQMSGAKTVLKIYNHGDFDPLTRDNDVALLRLSQPLTFGSTVAAVCLPNVGQSIGPESEAWITGWGNLSQSESTSADVLNQAQVSVYSRDTCRQVLGGMVTKTMMCAGTLEGGVDICQGDSGGPLVVSQGNVWWLAGDTSWGMGCAQRNKPGVYGNVTYSADWIRKTMKLL